MRRALIVLTVLVAGGASAASAASSKAEAKRIDDAAKVVRELRSAPDQGIPESIWDRAHCVAVMPGVKKAALVFGGEYGKGVVSCRTSNHWSAPVFFELEKGNVGAQIGGESIDVVLLVMNERGIERLLQDKVTLGVDASLAAGPVGRTGSAATDAQLTAELLSYSHARGLFAGIDLSGGVLRPDKSANEIFYGHAVSDRDVLYGKQGMAVPSAASSLISALEGKPAHGPSKHGS
jgi:SH3 domain-containing YSC84-like protein 1